MYQIELPGYDYYNFETWFRAQQFMEVALKHSDKETPRIRVEYVKEVHEEAAPEAAPVE